MFERKLKRKKKFQEGKRKEKKKKNGKDAERKMEKEGEKKGSKGKYGGGKNKKQPFLRKCVRRREKRKGWW